MKAIELKNVSIKLKNFNISDFSLSFHKGLITALIGKNGAGKTTLLKAITQLLPIKSGEIFINSEPLITEHWKDDIGVIWGEINFPIEFTPKQYDLFSKGIYPNWDSIYFKQFCEQFKIDWTQKVKNMSLGTIMKFQIGATLAHHPKLLLLDEPTNGLDPYAREEMISLLADYADVEDATIIISSHIISDIEKLADHLVVIEDGQLRLHMGKDELFDTFGLWSGSPEEFEKIPYKAVATSCVSNFGVKALIYKQLAPHLQFEIGTLEDYLLLIQVDEHASILDPKKFITN